MRNDWWDKIEEDIIKKEWNGSTYSQVSDALRSAGYMRSPSAVRNKGKKMGLPPASPRGTVSHREEIEAIVKEMWNGSFPAREISDAVFAKTGVEIHRHSIGIIAKRIGLAQRLGWYGKRKEKSLKAGSGSPLLPPWGAIPPESGDVSLAPGARAIPFMDDRLKSTMCRFVVGTGPSIMCAADVSHPGSAWCYYHRAMVYVPVRERGAAIKNINATAIGFERSKPGTTILRSDW